MNAAVMAFTKALAQLGIEDGVQVNCINPGLVRTARLHDRIEQLPSIIRDIAWKAQLRLCGRYRHLVAAGKAKVVVTTAIATVAAVVPTSRRPRTHTAIRHSVA